MKRHLVETSKPQRWVNDEAIGIKPMAIATAMLLRGGIRAPKEVRLRALSRCLLSPQARRQGVTNAKPAMRAAQAKAVTPRASQQQQRQTNQPQGRGRGRGSQTNTNRVGCSLRETVGLPVLLFHLLSQPPADFLSLG